MAYDELNELLLQLANSDANIDLVTYKILMPLFQAYEKGMYLNDKSRQKLYIDLKTWTNWIEYQKVLTN